MLTREYGIRGIYGPEILSNMVSRWFVAIMECGNHNPSQIVNGDHNTGYKVSLSNLGFAIGISLSANSMLGLLRWSPVLASIWDFKRTPTAMAPLQSLTFHFHGRNQQSTMSLSYRVLCTIQFLLWRLAMSNMSHPWSSQTIPFTAVSDTI